MQQAMQDYLPHADWIIMAAAVADVKPATYHAQKLPKRELPQRLQLAPVPDVVAELAMSKRPQQKLIGFAAQTGNIVKPALEKLKRKKLDAIVANPIDQPDSGFGSDSNQAILLDRTGRRVDLPACSKLEMAHYVLDFIQEIPAS
jgi:phosphopantothenoylcysteine decarboxylase / phosphopantothenate---cysteine ligase